MTFRSIRTTLAAGLVAALSSTYAVAEVLESSATGFLVKHVIPIAAPPGKVYDALV